MSSVSKPTKRLMKVTIHFSNQPGGDVALEEKRGTRKGKYVRMTHYPSLFYSISNYLECPDTHQVRVFLGIK